MNNIIRNNKNVISLIQTILAAIVTMGIVLDGAIAHSDEIPTEVGNVFYDQLDASPAAPKGISREYIAQVAKRTGINPKELTALAEQDICKSPDVESFCAYFGNQTVYKVRNLAWKLKIQGASDDTVMESIASVLEIGVSRRLNELYGERGLTDEGFDERNSSKIDNRLHTRNSGKRDAEKGNDNESLDELSRSKEGSKLLCAGLKTAIDQQTIGSTNPIYGRKYRLVTCAAGLNWRETWSFLGLEISIQAGLVVTHSRFSRRVLGLWHLTGADPQICSTANAMGNAVTNCNNYQWSSPISARMNILINQPTGAVFAKGHAHKLGQNFNTQINY